MKHFELKKWLRNQMAYSSDTSASFFSGVAFAFCFIDDCRCFIQLLSDEAICTKQERGIDEMKIRRMKAEELLCKGALLSHSFDQTSALVINSSINPADVREQCFLPKQALAAVYLWAEQRRKRKSMKLADQLKKKESECYISDSGADSPWR